MNETIWIQDQYESQYGLLGVMARELHGAFAACGHDARLMRLGADEMPTSGVFVFFNAPVSIDVLPEVLFTAGAALRGVQIFVDHPYALPEGVLDAWHERDGMANYRLCLPCVDDVHLLAMKWPGMKHDYMPHGIPRSALCDPETITREAWDAKKFDVVLTGSIGTQGEHDEGVGRLSRGLQNMIRDVISLMIARPAMGYVQACDVVMGSRGVITGKWSTGKMFWRLVISAVNRHRRVSVMESLQGLRVGVFGGEAWKSVCSGTVSYEGEVGYSEVASAFGRGRVAVAWGPTQFVHSLSERIMLAMAAGCAAISDDWLIVRRDFVGAQSCVGLYDSARPETARGCVGRMLANPDAAIELAKRGRRIVEECHLWEHRLETILAQPGVVSIAG